MSVHLTKPTLLRLSGLAAACVLQACSLMPDMPTFSLMGGNTALPELAQAQLVATNGNSVAGTVRFTRHGGDTLVEVSLNHLPPGVHGFHIHEKGDCSSGDGLSAGGHFNPAGQPHGGPDSPHHEGDLGNVTAGDDGMVNTNFHVKDLPLSGDTGIIGRAVIVHAAADDLKTQPTGNAGKRLACGTIVHL